MAKVVFPSFRTEGFSAEEMRQFVSAVDLRFQQLERIDEQIFDTTGGVGEGEFAPLVHTHVEADITDLQHVESIFDLTDVTGSPSVGNTLVWNGTAFEPSAAGGGATLLNDLTDVNAFPTDGQYLRWDISTLRWVADDLDIGDIGGVDTLVDLTDTNMTGQAQFDLLYNVGSGIWEPTGQAFQWTGGWIQLGNDVGINWYDTSLSSVEFLSLDTVSAADPTNLAFLCSFDGADTATTADDESVYDHTLTFLGSAQLDDTFAKFGATSLWGTGPGDSVTAPDSVAWTLSGDFTVETFVRFNGDPGTNNYVLVSHWDDSGNNRQWNLGLTNNFLRWGWSTDGAQNLTFEDWAWNPAGSVWYHVAIVRSGNTLEAFIDGTSLGSRTHTPAYFDADSVLRILAIKDVGGVQQNLIGHIDEMRITNGVARYTANFTAPTAPFDPTDYGSTTVEAFTVGDPNYQAEIDGTLIGLKNGIGVNWDNLSGSNVELLNFFGASSLVSSEWGTNGNTDWTYVGAVGTQAEMETTGIGQGYTAWLDVWHTSDDGLDVIVGGNGNDQMRSFRLDAPYDYLNATQTGTTKSLTNPWYSAQWIDSGTKYIVQTADNNLREFTAGTAYQVNSSDVNTQTVSNNSLGFPTSGESSYWMSRDGTRLVGCGEISGSQFFFRTFTLSTPYDISTFSLDQSVRMDNITNGPTGQFIGFQFSDDGLTVVGIFNRRFWIGTMTSAYDVSTLSFEAGNERNLQTDSGDATAAVVQVSTDGNRLFVLTDNSTSGTVYEYTKTVQNPSVELESFYVGDPGYGTEIDGTLIGLKNNIGINWDNAAGDNVEHLVFESVSTPPSFAADIEVYLDFDGADADTTYTDEAGNAWNFIGVNSELSTDFVKFGSSSFTINGETANSSWLTNGTWSGSAYTAGSGNIDLANFDTGDWTIELFYYVDDPDENASFSGGNLLLGQIGSNQTTRSYSWRIEIQNGSLVMNYHKGTGQNGTENNFRSFGNGFGRNSWVHVVIERFGGTIAGYLNGIQRPTTFSDAGFIYSGGTGPIEVLGAGNYGTSSDSIYVDDVRITVGTAVYGGASSFTPPTEPGSPTGPSSDLFVVGDPNYPTRIDGSETTINNGGGQQFARFYDTAGGLPTTQAPHIIAGDPGFEEDGISVNDVDYESVLKVSDLGGTNEALLHLHRHSDTLTPILVSSRARNDDATHGDVLDDDVLLSIIATGWNTDTYNISSEIRMEVDGTPSATAMPGQITFQTAPAGTRSGLDRMRIRADGSVEFVGPDQTSMAALSHDNTDFNLVGTSTGQFDISGLTTGVVLNDMVMRIDAFSSGAAHPIQLWYDDAAEREVLSVTRETGTAPMFRMSATAVGNMKFIDPQGSNNIWLQMVTASDVRIRDGYEFRIYDSTDLNFVSHQAGATDFTSTFANQTDWDILGLTGEVFVDADLRTSGTLFTDLIDSTAGGAIRIADRVQLDRETNAGSYLQVGPRDATLRGDAQEGSLYLTGEDTGVVYGSVMTQSSGSLVLQPSTFGGATGATEFFANINTRIGGNLQVDGTTTTINSATVSIADNIILLNSDVTGVPTENSGIEVERGTSANVLLRWNETSDRWEFTNDGTVYQNILIESEIDHNALTNTHNLTTDIDHDALTNYVADEHLDWTANLGGVSTVATENLAPWLTIDTFTENPQWPLVMYSRFGGGVNYDNILDAGIFGTASGNTNGPVGTYTFNPLLVMRNSSDVRVQLEAPRSASQPIAWRGYSSSVWGAWHYTGWTTTPADADLSIYVKTADLGTGAVTSFNGRVGAVSPIQADYDSFFLTPAEGDAAYAPLQDYLRADVADTALGFITFKQGLSIDEDVSNAGLNMVVDSDTYGHDILYTVGSTLSALVRYTDSNKRVVWQDRDPTSREIFRMQLSSGSEEFRIRYGGDFAINTTDNATTSYRIVPGATTAATTIIEQTGNLAWTGQDNYIFGDTAATKLTTGPWTGAADVGVYVEGTTNLDNVEIGVGVGEGANNRRARFFVSDEQGTFGLHGSASSGVPDFSLWVGAFENIISASTTRTNIRGNNIADPLALTRVSPSADQVSMSFVATGTRHFGKGTDNEPYWHTDANITNGSMVTTESNNPTLTGDWTFGTTSTVLFNTNSNANPVLISRTGGTAEALSLGVADTVAAVRYDNDEISGTIQFTIDNADTETGGGAGANTTTWNLFATDGRSYLQVPATGEFLFAEKAARGATPAAGQGLLWLRNDTPNALIFTDDAGTDIDLTAGGLANGTVTNSMLRWSGSAWVEETQALLTSNGAFTLRDSTLADTITLQHNGVDASFAINAGDLEFTTAGGNWQFLGGREIRIYEGTNAEWMQFDTTLTQGNITVASGSVIRMVSGSTQMLQLATGLSTMLSDFEITGTGNGIKIPQDGLFEAGNLGEFYSTNNDTILQCTGTSAGNDLFISANNGDNRLIAFQTGSTSLYYGTDAVGNPCLQTTADVAATLTRVDVEHADGNLYDIGLAKMPILEQDTSITLGTSQHQKYIHCDASSGTTQYTCSNNSNIQTGTTWMINNETTSTGAVQIVQGTGVTLRWMAGTGTPSTGTRTLARGGVCTVIKYGVAEYHIWGIGLS